MPAPPPPIRLLPFCLNDFFGPILHLAWLSLFRRFSTLFINLDPLRIAFIKSEAKGKCFWGSFYLGKWGKVEWSRWRELICISGRSHLIIKKMSLFELAWERGDWLWECKGCSWNPVVGVQLGLIVFGSSCLPCSLFGVFLSCLLFCMAAPFCFLQHLPLQGSYLLFSHNFGLYLT